MNNNESWLNALAGINGDDAAAAKASIAVMAAHPQFLADFTAWGPAGNAARQAWNRAHEIAYPNTIEHHRPG